MFQTVFRATAGAVLLTFSVWAQQSGTPPTPPTPAQRVTHQVDRLTTLLNLTSAQQEQATTIFTTEQASLATVRSSMQAAHTSLQTAIESNDTAGISAQATQIGTLTTQEVQTQATAQAAFYAILTADQQTKYKQLVASGPGGPGGFGGFRH